MWLALLTLPLLAGTDDSFLLRNVTVHPVSGPDIQNGSVLVTDGRIAGVGTRLSAPKGVRVVDGKGLHVYPGMIDSATQMGLSEISSVRETNDTGELGDFNPQLRSLVAVNPSSEHIPVTRASGITSVVTMPMGVGGGGAGATAAGGLIAGQAALIHLDGWTWEEMAVKPAVAMAGRFPTIQTATFRFPEGRTTKPFAEARRDYDEQVRKFRTFLEDARRYQRAKAAGGKDLQVDLKLEAMLPVLEGKVPLLLIASRERAIRDAVEFADREKVKVILADVRRPGAMLPVLKEKSIPVILGQVLELPQEEDDPYDMPFTLPAELHKAGVKFAFGTFTTSFSRNLPFEAAAAAGFGLPKEAALRAVTLAPAEIWGVADRLGSIEEGKLADLVVTDGDLLEAKTQVKQLFIQGKPVDLTNRHVQLYEKYRQRP